MFGTPPSSNPMPMDPNDRLGRIEAKVDRVARWNLVTMVVSILVLLTLIAIIV
jgi:hypothetical protein